MGYIQMELSRKTLAEFATEVGRNYDTVFRAAKRVIPGTVSAGMLLTPEMENEISSAMRSAKSAKKKTGTVRRSQADKTMAAQGTTARPNEVAPPMAEKTPENPSADWMLDFINYFENAAAFTGFVLLFDWVGIAPGLICCAFYLHSMAVMKREGAWESAMLAKSICFVIAAVFGWVHFQTFTWALNEYRPDIEGAFWVSVCGAALLSGISLTALYQSRNVKIDKQ